MLLKQFPCFALRTLYCACSNSLASLRLPIVQGGTFSFLTPTIAILSLPKWQCPSSSAPTMAPTGNIHIYWSKICYYKMWTKDGNASKVQTTWPEASRGLYFILAAFMNTGLPRGNGQEGDSCPIRGAIPTQSHNRVDHTTGVYVPYSFRTAVWVLLRPTRTDYWKCCETGLTVSRPYLEEREKWPDGSPITHALFFL